MRTGGPRYTGPVIAWVRWMRQPKATKTQRLDVRLLDLGLFASRQTAQAAIMDGAISVNGQKVVKPGTPVDSAAVVTVAPNWGPTKYVSRGGLKLEKALAQFKINLTDRTCLDVGASTGGFTDCMLQHGASRVYAIDVGYGQLDWKLRQDQRVVVKERTNARYLTPDELYRDNESRADFSSMDVSFISVLKVLPACLQLMGPDRIEIVCLIKPQFEAGRELVGKGGVVRSADAHISTIKSILAGAEELQLFAQNLTYSPVKGPSGNIEFLVHWLHQAEAGELSVEDVVSEAHRSLE